MSIIFLLIPLSVLLATCFLAAFIWAVRSGQYDDTCTPSMRLLTPDVPAGRSEPGVALRPGTDEVKPPSATAHQPLSNDARGIRAGDRRNRDI